MIYQLLVATWFVFVVASAFANAYFKRMAKTEAVVHIGTEFQTLGKAIATVQKTLDGKSQIARLSEPKEATRVYAMVLQRGLESRIIIQPANTFEAMSEIVNRELGTGWMVVMSAYCDALGWNTPQPEIKVATVEPPIASFIHDLEYSRDKFADTPTQKRALDSIIQKVKQQHYGISRSGTSA